MQCTAITLLKTQCSRNAELNSEYCWQHQKSLVSQTLQPGILANINLYTGHIKHYSKTFYSDVNKLTILANWFSNIHVKTPFSEVKESEIPLLWNLYLTKIDNSPNREALKIAIEAGLNPDLFHAKEYICDIKIPELPEHSIDFIEDDMKLINIRLAEFLIINNLRVGDTVKLLQFANEEDIPRIERDYRDDGILIYDGTKLLNLIYTRWEQYVTLPHQIHINDYPIVGYFRSSVFRYKYFNFDTTGIRIKLVRYIQSKFKLDISRPEFEPRMIQDAVYEEKTQSYTRTLYLYKTTGNNPYKIWSTYPLLGELWHDIITLSSVLPNQYTMEYFSKKMLDAVSESTKSLKMLYYRHNE